MKFLMEQNISTVKNFVQLLIEGVTTQINDLLKDNEDLKRSLEFSQAEIDTLKKRHGTHPP